MQVERLKLDMEFEIMEFYKWTIKNSLTATEISLWHGLMYVANEAGYPIWLSIPLSRLEKITGMKKDAIYKAREGLENKGRIEILQGKGNQAAKYRIISFATEHTEDDRNSEIPEIDESIEQPPMDPIEETQEEPIKTNIFRRTQDIIPMPPPIDIHHIKQLLDEGMEDELLCEAVNITLESEEVKNKPPMDKWKYFKGIIRNWYNNRIMTYEEYQKHEMQREAQINGGNRKNHRRVQPETEFKESGMREFRIPGQ